MTRRSRRAIFPGPHIEPALRYSTVSRSRHGRVAGTPQMVGDIVGRFLKKRGLTGKVEAASVIPEWPDLVGPQITRVTRPLRVSEGVLFVGVTSSAWMMELNLMKSDLMRRINAGKREGKIKQLIFLMAEK